MRKGFLAILCTLLLTAPVFANARSISEAQQVAKQFMSSNQSSMVKRMGRELPQLVYTEHYADKPAVYVFNAGQGFVLVSANDNTCDILGYSDTGAFDETTMPDNMRFWLQQYAEEINYAASLNTSAASSEEQNYTPVAPLLGAIEWGQQEPYNNLCPIDQTDNTRSYTGCVATGTAQIMRYWKYPVQGTGSHTDNWKQGGGSGSEFADFGATTYDWDNMLQSYTGSYTQEQADAVATLMYHVGVACDMKYGGEQNKGSEATQDKAAKALWTYFKYDKGMRYIKKNAFNATQFKQYFIEELQAKRPILMGGKSASGGHEFVCDGMDKNGFFHINWGWTGQYNGYFALSALRPTKPSATDDPNKYGYSTEVDAFIGIQPDQGNPPIAQLVFGVDVGGRYDFHFSSMAAKKSQEIEFTGKIYNNGFMDLVDTPIAYLVYNEDSTFMQVFGQSTFSSSSDVSLSAAFDGLEAGDYLLAVGYRFDDKQDWIPIVAEGAFTFFKMHTTADSVYICIPGHDFSNDLNTGHLYYGSNLGGPWLLELTSLPNWLPSINCFFDSNSKTTIAGTYQMTAKKALAYWLTSEPLEAITGTLTLKRVSGNSSSKYPFYKIDLQFVTADDETYEVHTTLPLNAQDATDDWKQMTLTDPIESDPDPEQQSISQTSAQRSTLNAKRLVNGQLFIQRGNELFNAQGARVK